MVTASQWRRAVDHLKSRAVSERRACRLTGFSRSAAWYQLKGRDDGDLRARLKALAEPGCRADGNWSATVSNVLGYSAEYYKLAEKMLE